MAARKAEVIITCDATTVKQVLEGLNREMAKTNQRRQQLQQQQASGVRLTKQEEKELQNLIKYENALAEKQQKVTNETRKMGEVMKDLAGTKSKDLKKALREGKQALDNMAARDPNRQKLIEDLQRIQRQIEKNTAGMQSFGKAHNTVWQTAVRNITAYMGVFAAFNKAKELLNTFIEKNKEYSDQMANVRKVSGLAMDDIARLSDRLSTIDSRTSLSGLMQLSYTGAKLGFGEYGIEGLESFARSAVKVQNALSEDFQGDAMTALSKMVEVMGLIPKMGVEKAMDATGSAIFKLASTSTATGTNIVEFSKRLMGLANVSHVTTAELLGLASASDAAALMPEVSATAFNKIFTSIQTNTKGIEKALGDTSGELQNLISQGKTMEGIVYVLEKMHNMSMEEMKGRGLFKALGSDGARLNNVIATLSNRVDLLQSHLAVANEAFEDGTAVAQEYAIQMNTAAAYSERAANIWEKAFVNPQGVDTVREFTKAWYDVSKALTANEVAMGQLKFLLGGIMELMKAIIYMAPALINGLSIWGGARLFAMMKTSLELNTIRTAVQGLTFSLGALKTAWSALSIVGKANWIGAIATAVFMAVEALGMFNKKIEESTGYLHGFKNGLEDLNVEYGKGEAELRRYRKAIDEANVGTKQRAAAINQFNQKFKPYLSNLLTEKSTALDVAKAYNEVCKQMRTKIALQLRDKDINEQVIPREQWTIQRREEYDKAARKAGMSQYGSAWITGYAQDNSKKSIDNMVRDIGKQYYNLPAQVIDQVAKQAARGNRTFNNGAMNTLINSQYLPQANALLAASGYLRQNRAAENAQYRVNQKYAPEEAAFNEMLAAQNQEEPITPYEGDGGGDKKGSGKKAPEWMVEEKKEAEKAARAVIGSIEEFYRLQEAAANELAANGMLKGEEFDMLVNHIKDRKDKVLLEARRAIVGDPNEFENIRQTLNTDLVKRDDAVSLAAMQRIQQAEPAKAGEKLRKYNGSDAVYNLDSNSYLNDIRKNAAQNELNIQRRQAKVQQEIDKILVQFQYIEQAQQKFGDKLVTLGLITDGYDKVVQQLADGTKIIANSADVTALANKTVGMGTRLYDVNLASKESIKQFLGDLFVNANNERESFADIFPRLNDWISDPEKNIDDIKAFYQTLIDMDDEYYSALKRNYDRDKKLFQERWERSGQGETFGDAQKTLGLMGRATKLTGAERGTNFAQQAGFTTLDEDPELAASMLRMEQMQRELEMLKQVSEDKKLIREQEMALAEAQMDMEETIMAKINERIQKLQEWTEPINAFAETMGAAAGDAIRNSISMSEQVQEALKSMVKAYGDSAIKIISNLLMQQLKERMIRRALAKDAKDNQEEVTEIEKEGGQQRLEARSIVETGIASITQQMGSQILATKKQQDQQEMAEEGAKAQGGVMAGIAEGAAKIIGSLGWWGIPLIAVITALLNGLLNMALNALFGGGGGDNSNSSSSTTKTKLVSGMLTYDSGNVQTIIGTDGRIYRATPEDHLQTGLVTKPIATMVNGQPGLVAEQGPEIVIGRETTQAIMMNEPGLLQHLIDIDRFRSGAAYRPFAEGNVQQASGTVPDASASGSNPLDANTLAALRALPAVMQQLTAQLQKPVHINMYGTGGLDESMTKRDAFRSKHPVRNG